MRPTVWSSIISLLHLQPAWEKVVRHKVLGRFVTSWKVIRVSVSPEIKLSRPLHVVAANLLQVCLTCWIKMAPNLNLPLRHTQLKSNKLLSSILEELLTVMTLSSWIQKQFSLSPLLINLIPLCDTVDCRYINKNPDQLLTFTQLPYVTIRYTSKVSPDLGPRYIIENQIYCKDLASPRSREGHQSVTGFWKSLATQHEKSQVQAPRVSAKDTHTCDGIVLRAGAVGVGEVRMIGRKCRAQHVSLIQTHSRQMSQIAW